jgi:hypothetical protein
LRASGPVPANAEYAILREVPIRDSDAGGQ